MASATARNITFLGQTEQGGRPDAAQVMVHRGHAYVGHLFSRGLSIIDVRDPRDPKPVNYLEAAPDTWTLHLQIANDLMLVVNEANLLFPEVLTRSEPRYEAGLRIYDVSTPESPKEISFFPVKGAGVHRLWYDGGRYAYLSCLLDGYTGHILVIVDVFDPTKPSEIGRFWLPGMWEAEGETPSWGDRNVSLHHALVADGVAYAAWRDAGLVLIDVKDPSAPQLIAQHSWSPPYAGNTHNALPLPNRQLVVALDEADDVWPDPGKHIWAIDVRSKENPVNIARFPAPSEQDFEARDARSGPHNLWENRAGAFQSSELIFATHCSAGVRVYDISDAYRPEEVACFVPDDPSSMVDPRPGGQPIVQTADSFVDSEGIIYATDYNAGLSILQFEGS